jgi:hypothetical protein
VGCLVDGRSFGSVSAGGFEFNHLSESGPLTAWSQFGSGANARPKDSGTGLIDPTAGAYCENEEVRRHLPQMPRRLSPG